MYVTKVSAGLLACALFSPVAVSAASLDAQTLLQSINVIVLEDMDLLGTDHVEGPTYVGGDVNSGTLAPGSTRTNTSYNTDGMADATVGDVTGSLIVGGTVTGDLSSNTKGDVVIGTAYSGASGATGSTTTNVGTNTAGGVPVDEMTATFDALTDSLSAISTTTDATFNSAQNFKRFTSGTGGDDGIAVLNLAYSDAVAMFTASEQIQFTLDADVTSFIINVAGTSFTDFGAQININQPLVLFNFYEATTLTFGSSPFNASVLATNALVTSPNGGINGTLVAENLILGGEVRPYDNTYVFSGALPAEAPSAVPLPAALPLALSGVIALGALRRKRRKAA